MKVLFLILLLAATGSHVFGQSGQADQIKRRAKDLVNQNNARQGVPPPAPAQPPPQPAAPVPAATPAKSNASANANLQAENIARIKADLAAIKPVSMATSDQKQKLVIDVAGSARAAKPSLANVKQFTDALTLALGGATLNAEQQERLARNIEAVLNSKPISAAQYEAINADVQSILEAGGAKKNLAQFTATNLKVIGDEVRR